MGWIQILYTVAAASGCATATLEGCAAGETVGAAVASFSLTTGPVDALDDAPALAARMAAYSIRPKIFATVKTMNASHANATIAVAVSC